MKIHLIGLVVIQSAEKKSVNVKDIETNPL